ncbi:MAG: glycosyl hydrolase 115 family protein [Proteobacteria bacterium]|nr:glycosyl hydrolase 115 family protein [Pseudomonadota bacterium]
MTRSLLVCAAMMFAITGWGCTATTDEIVALEPGVPILVDPAAPDPVHRAVRDLQRDLELVLGVPSPIVNSLPDTAGQSVIVVSGTGSLTAEFRDASLRGSEAYRVTVKEKNGVPHIVLQGTDMRGTIYAIYEFSKEFLNIPPLWFWASWEHDRLSSVDVPVDTRIVFDEPYVKWRAWFPNDRDLFSPWQERAPENYEAFLETMLRLKMNTLEGRLMDSDAFNQAFTAGREARAARDRGLVITGHHVFTFGSSMRDWDNYGQKIRNQEPPRTSIKNVDALRSFWRYHIETNIKERMDIIWLIGFRGHRDIPFWAFYEDSPESDAERGAVIEQMMNEQVKLLKEVTEDASPPMRTTLYSEKSLLFAAGHLRPPSDPTLIWNFVAARRDHFPAADLRNMEVPEDRPIGYYMNFQFTSSGSHLAQGEGPWKMERNFRYVDGKNARPLEFSVVNAGNIREFVMTMSANAALLWDFQGYDTDSFMQAFCTQYFGAEHASDIANLYRDYFDSYWQQKRPDLNGFPRQYIFQDMRYARAIEQLTAHFATGYAPNPLRDQGFSTPGEYFRIVPQDTGTGDQLEAIVKGTEGSIAKLKQVVARGEQLFEALPPSKRVFFNDNLLIHARFMLHLNETLNAVTRAFMTLESGAGESTVDLLDTAANSLDATRHALDQAEHGRFTRWYDGDTKFKMDGLKERIHQARDNIRAADG